MTGTGGAAATSRCPFVGNTAALICYAGARLFLAANAAFLKTCFALK